MARRDWTRDELIVAFNLYCRIPFGRIHKRNPEIISLAKAIGRTPSAVSWKLANFSRLDPNVTGRKLTGATHGSRLEEEIWEEFTGNWNELSFISEELKARFLGRDLEVPRIIEEFPEGLNRPANVMVRINQGFFRSTVLAAYDGRCCITGLSIVELLCASHIVPWSKDPANRTNPRNGLCLNAIHDKAFDRGLITIDHTFRVKISPTIKLVKDEVLNDLIFRYDGHPINAPKHFAPDPAFLRHHMENTFRHS